MTRTLFSGTSRVVARLRFRKYGIWVLVQMVKSPLWASYWARAAWGSMGAWFTAWE